jgi:tetratricopeptide (TPR) repeat protein
MAKICEAVQHAHQLGVIHRDLKPANILVEENGQPKILDFGVARVTDREAQTTRQTEVGQIVGTLAYMSPEQVLGDPLAVDTRSDVYGLGVILYELLAGRLPYKISRQLPEAVQTIREEEPTRLSSVSRTYRGDVETIVGKALEKEKAQRYASAAELAADLQRYLRDEPITARPPSATYQLQKFARRHRGLVAGVAAVFVVLIAGIVVSVWEATRALRAEATAQAVNNFLRNDLLSQASASTQARPDTKPDPDLKVRTVLDRAAAHISGKFDKQPLVEASIRQTIGNTYGDLGLYPEAQQQLERALDLQRRVRGEEHPDTLVTMNNLAQLYQDQGQYARAESLLTKALEAQRRVRGEEHRDTLQSMYYLAQLYQQHGKYARVEPLLTRALEIQRRVLGEEHRDTMVSLNNLAQLDELQGKYAQAEPLYIKLLDTNRRVRGEEHPDTLVTMNNLAKICFDQGQYARAESLLTKFLEVAPRVLGEEHPYTTNSMNGLGILYRNQGRYTEAESLFTRALETHRRVLGEEHPNTLSGMENLAVLYRNQGKYAQAEPLFIKVLETESRVLGPAHSTTLRHTNDLALLYVDTGQYAQAERLLREALSRYQTDKVSNWNPSYCQSLLGASLTGQKKFAEAEPLLLSGYHGMLQQASIVSWERRSALKNGAQWIIQLYQEWGKPEKVTEWRNTLQKISF